MLSLPRGVICDILDARGPCLQVLFTQERISPCEFKFSIRKARRIGQTFTSPEMLPPSSEIDALLPKTSPSSLNHDFEYLSTLPSTTLDASPQVEGRTQLSGDIKAELKLFLALLVDSVPSKNALSTQDKFSNNDKYSYFELYSTELPSDR